MLVYIWYAQREINLINLQKAILASKTDVERQKILERLDKYYLTMSIPDSVQRRVHAEADTLIKRQERNSPLAIIDDELDNNIYQVENQLKVVLRDAIIACIRGDDSIFQSIIKYAKTLADTVDKGTDNNYWRPWVVKVESFDSSKAMIWLLADRAERCCHRYCVSESIEAEKYGARGLQLVEQIKDYRLRLDITQRLFFILYRLREMYDLSYVFAKREIQKAYDLKYIIRNTGFLFNYAEGLYLAGQNKLALETYVETIKRAKKFSKVPGIVWYEINGNLGMAKAHWELSNYERTLSLCKEIEKLKLDTDQKIQLHNLKGIAHRNLGNYDKAKEEYNKSLDLTISDKKYYMQVIVLRNLGTLYHRLTEYDMASYYFTEAMALHQKYNSQNIGAKIRLLISFAETKAAQREIKDFNLLIQEADDLTKLINLPKKKAELLRSLGRFNMNLGKYHQAYSPFKQAIALYEDYGLLRAALETKCDLVESLIELSDYETAKDLLEEIYILATNIHDAQRKIDAVGMKAEIFHKEGNLDNAIQASNQLINEIETLSTRFTDIDNLTFFRQKIHHYLQNAVIYELEKQRIDSAFIKLDYSKAWALKNRIWNDANKSSNISNLSYFMDIENFKALLSEKQLVVNYFVTQDTLYAFVMNRENLGLLKKSIKIGELRKLVNTYINSINETIYIFEKHQPNNFVAHYDSVAALSSNLYQTLLGWQKMQGCLQDVDITYIIPDDILYEIPFSCLMRSNEKVTRFLIQQTAIANLPSAMLLQSRQKRNIELTIDKKRVLYSIDWRLPGAKDLFKFIKKQFPLAEELIINKPVIEKRDVLLKLSQRYDVYIFVGHSVCNTKTPDSSFFELPAISQVDSSATIIPITLADLKHIDWSQAEMVFLIGCETAKGKEYKGTGLAGIQQGILISGAHEVMASLWKIDANQTKSQIIDFLESWLQNKNSAFALRDMQIKTIQDLQNDSYYKRAHPYIWGSYSLLKMVN